jgi:hypothetical protein
MLVEYRLRHNFYVGTFNRLGVEYKGHYDPWLTQHLDFLRQSMEMTIVNQKKHIAIEANALIFRESKEVFDICPLPDEDMERLIIIKKDTGDTLVQNNNVDEIENDLTIPKMKDSVFLNIGSTLREKDCRYHFVAKFQKTKYAVIAVHTLEEKLMFGRMVNQIPESSSRTTPNFDQLAKD